MKLFAISLMLILIPNICFGEDYVCEIKHNDNTDISPLKDSVPKILQITYLKKTNELVDFSWDGKSVIEHFEAVEFSSSSKILEIWTKKHPLTSLEKEDIEKGVYFELYASDLVGHFYKQFIPGVDYECIIY